MILLDLSPIIIANGCSTYAKTKTLEVDFLRHKVLNSIRFYNKQFRTQYGEMVLCLDSHHYWRKAEFKHYKSHRKEAQAKSSMDWDKLFQCMNIIKKECVEHLPYRAVNIYGAEADDVIATLALHTKGKHVVISADKDFMQLLHNPNIRLFSAKTKKYMSCKSPKSFLLEQIIRGDAGDGIPNIKSDNDTFVCSGKRQAQIRSEFLYTILQADDIHKWLGEFERMRFDENELLIDLTKIPQNIKDDIIAALDTKYPIGRYHVLFKYFLTNGLVELNKQIADFKPNLS